MKAILISTLLVANLALSAPAQDKKTATDFPFWVIESNVKTPKNSTIKFYNAKQELIYQETVNGKRVKTEKPKIQASLNSILTQLLQNRESTFSGTIVTATLNKKW